MAAQALQNHFDRIRRAELARLGGKFSALTAEERATLDDVTAHVVRMLAERPARALATSGSALLVRAVIDLFKVA